MLTSDPPLTGETITDAQIERLYSLAAACHLYDLCRECVLARAVPSLAARERCAGAINAMRLWLAKPEPSERDRIGELG